LKKESREINLLELVPVHNLRWEKNEEGLITLLKPKYRHSLLRKHLLPRMKKPYYRVRLDAIGSYIWESCDGKRKVRQVGEMLRDRFGEEVQPLYERLSSFLHSLEKNDFIYFEGLPQKRPPN